MAEIPSNPVPFEVLDDDTTPPRIGLELTAYAYDDPFTPLDVIPMRTSLKCLDEIEGPGGGSFRVFRNDPKLVETPNLLDYDNIFKVALDGKVIGAFIKGDEEIDFLNQNERSGEYIESSGEGLRGWFHGAVVEPYRGIRNDSQDARVFSFASERGSWYKSADWKTPVLIQQHSLDPNDGPFNTAPADWPDAPSAYWIWGEANDGEDPAPEGLNFFRYEFTVSGLTGTAPYAVFAAAKDQFLVYLDGQQIIDAREDDAYSKTWRADFNLANGDHILAVKVLSKGTGAAGMIAALFKSGDATAGTEAQLVKVTNASDWKVNPYPDPAPGWTPGEIMNTLLDEAEARGVRFPTFLTPTFTNTLDSDGVEWPRSLDWSFDIGSEYFDVIEKLEELVCDLWIDPDTYELNMYVERGSHRDIQSAVVEPVKFEIAKNVTRAQATGTSEIKNSLLMRTEDGWTSIADGLSDSISKYGRREGFVSTGASNSVSSDLAQRIFKQKAKPSVSATYDVIDVDGARPFFDFGAGDWVLAPSEKDEMLLASRRAMSLSVSENDETGQPIFAIEFDTIAQDLARRFDRWLKTTSDGTLGGTLANVAGGSGGGGNGSPSGQSVRTGPSGSTGPRGFPGFRNRGVWSASEVYQVSDSVSWNSQWWVANAETNEEPSGLAEDWDLLEVAPSTSPDIGATLYRTSDYVAVAEAVAIPWTGERYKSSIQHDPNSANLVILEPGPYLISGKFAMASNGWREYSVQVNGVTVATASSAAVSYTTTRFVADLPSFLVNLAVGDVVRVVTNGVNPHIILPSLDTWFSIAKISGLRGDTGPQGQSLLWRGEWGLGTTYAPYDIVQVDGSAYICISGHVGTVASRPGTGFGWTTRWELIASRGSVGADSTVPGPQGTSLVYRGGWLSSTSYVVGDTVTYDSDLYIANAANTNQTPGVSAAWDFINSGGGGGGSGYIRQTTDLTAVSGSGTFPVASSAFRLISMVSDGAARIRLYRSDADRTADAARPYDEAPDVQGVVLAEFRWTAPGTYWGTGYISSLAAGETTVYYLVDGGPVTLGLTWIGAD